MQFYSWILQNKEVLKLIYTLIIGLICLAIVLKTHRLFKISLHQGIRYFRNAFLFYGIAFISRYVFSLVRGLSEGSARLYGSAVLIIFEFFLIMAGFFLLYSLVWRKLEQGKEHKISSLFNLNVGLFYLMAAILTVLDFVWQTYSFMFISQIIIFSYASGVATAKLSESQGKGFINLYLGIMLLNLSAWVVSFVVAGFFDWSQGGVMATYGFNAVIFVLFYYIVNKSTKK
jgi:hypothetical protein